jgi:hypothetical protein
MPDDRSRDENETMYSGRMGERNRNTPGSTPRELGLDPEEMRGHDIAGEPSGGGGTIDFVPDTTGNRTNPPLTEGVEGMGEGGVSASGGAAGGDRGNAGTSNRGAGGPLGESRGGPGEYKSTSRGTFDRGME